MQVSKRQAVLLAAAAVSISAFALVQASRADAPQAAAKAHVDDFMLADQNLLARQLYRMSDDKAVVLVTYASGDKQLRADAPPEFKPPLPDEVLHSACPVVRPGNIARHSASCDGRSPTRHPGRARMRSVRAPSRDLAARSSTLPRGPGSTRSRAPAGMTGGECRLATRFAVSRDASTEQRGARGRPAGLARTGLKAWR